MKVLVVNSAINDMALWSREQTVLRELIERDLRTIARARWLELIAYRQNSLSLELVFIGRPIFVAPILETFREVLTLRLRKTYPAHRCGVLGGIISVAEVDDSHLPAESFLPIQNIGIPWLTARSR